MVPSQWEKKKNTPFFGGYWPRVDIKSHKIHHSHPFPTVSGALFKNFMPHPRGTSGHRTWCCWGLPCQAPCNRRWPHNTMVITMLFYGILMITMMDYSFFSWTILFYKMIKLDKTWWYRHDKTMKHGDLTIMFRVTHARKPVIRLTQMGH